MKLYTPFQIHQLQQDLPHLMEILDWVKSFLAKHHSDLGRPGPVCPYVPHSLKSNSIEIGVIRSKNLEPHQVENIVAEYKDIFLETAAKAKEPSINQAFLLVFPDLPLLEASELIDGIQKKLKPVFVDSGLMIGEFHGRTQTGGLHNPNFRPLRSPIPLLAIRFMVEADLAFLQNADNPQLYLRYLKAYLKRFGNEITDQEKLQNLHAKLALLQSEINVDSLVSY
jgi:hypothetical protein